MLTGQFSDQFNKYKRPLPRCKLQEMFFRQQRPGKHGGVERVNRVFLQGARTILSKLGKDDRDWPDVTPTIMGCLNKTLTVSSRGNKTPVELMTGLQPKDAVDHIA